MALVIPVAHYNYKTEKETVPQSENQRWYVITL